MCKKLLLTKKLFKNSIFKITGQMGMKFFQLKLFYFYNKSILLKTMLFLMISLLCIWSLTAQKESNFQLKIETGPLTDLVKKRMDYSRSFFSGAFLHVEFKLKTSKNTFIGLRIGPSQNTQLIKNSFSNQFDILDKIDFKNHWNGIASNDVFSFVPTFDYHYFMGKNLRPYFGVGIGWNLLSTAKKTFAIGNRFDELELSVNNQVGFLIRGGFGFRKLIVGRFDLSKFSLGLEYYFVPKTDVNISNGQKIGTLANSYLGFSMGYTIGLGKRLK